MKNEAVEFESARQSALNDLNAILETANNMSLETRGVGKVKNLIAVLQNPDGLKEAVKNEIEFHLWEQQRQLQREEHEKFVQENYSLNVGDEVTYVKSASGAEDVHYKGKVVRVTKTKAIVEVQGRNMEFKRIGSPYDGMCSWNEFADSAWSRRRVRVQRPLTNPQPEPNIKF